MLQLADPYSATTAAIAWQRYSGARFTAQGKPDDVGQELSCGCVGSCSLVADTRVWWRGMCAATTVVAGSCSRWGPLCVLCVRALVCLTNGPLPFITRVTPVKCAGTTVHRSECSESEPLCNTAGPRCPCQAMATAASPTTGAAPPRTRIQQAVHVTRRKRDCRAASNSCWIHRQR